jgi:hypothetical protein
VNLSQYGPFANVVALASALIATFSMLLLKMLGSVKRWTWLASGAPPFLVTAAARMFAVALMAVTYVTISKSNYGWFAAAAVLCGVLGFVAVARFDLLRERHVVPIAMVGADGRPLLDRRKQVVQQNLVIGLEADLRDDAKAALAEARKKKAGLSVRQFMSGFGPQRVNDPEALWDPALLADTRSTLTITLMCIVLLAVMALFLSAFTIEVFNR